MSKKGLLTVVATVALACFVILPAVAHGQQQATQAHAKKSGFVIGFTNGYFGNNWRSQYVDDAKAEAQKWEARGVIKKFIVENVNNDVSKQIVQLNALLDQGVNALMIDPVSAASLAGVVHRAKSLGVLIVIDDDPAAYKGTYDVSGDNPAFIAIQAKWLAEQLKGKQANIVYMQGLAGNSANNVRNAAVHGVLKNFPNIHIIATGPGGWNETTAYNNMTNWLSAYHNINGVLTQDIMAQGIMRAYETAGKPLPVMTGDYNMGFFRAWAAHPNMKSIGVTYQPGIAAAGVQVAVRLLEGWKFKPGVLGPNQVNPSLHNTLVVPPAYVVTRDKASYNASFLEGFGIRKFTQRLSLKEALAKGKGQPNSYLLDGFTPTKAMNSLFIQPKG